MMILSTEKTKLYQEFVNIENKKLWKIVLMSLKEESDKLTKNKTFDDARKSDNRTRNRYRDVLPYDSNRVRLADNDLSDYINASYVSLENNKYGRRYILTQGPLESTVSHFWKMVWDEGTTCIVMLNRIIEKGNIKCAQYYPHREDESYRYPENFLFVSLVDSHNENSYTKRLLQLTNEKTGESRSVVQFHFQSWPDFGVPCSSELFLQFLWDVRASGGLDDPDRPAVIHCSAGIGRSGTFILIDLSLLQIFEDKSCERVDLQDMVVQLRKCRVGLIQTADQLRFAYSSVILATSSLLSSENIANPDLIKFNEMHPNKIFLDQSESDRLFFMSRFEQDHENEEGEEEDEEEEEEDGQEGNVIGRRRRRRGRGGEGEERCGDADSDLSENSDSNSALDKAAAAVRARRGLPPTNDDCQSSLLFATKNNYKQEDVAVEKNIDVSFSTVVHRSNSSAESTEEQNRKKHFREIRSNRTREIIDQIRTKMRQQNLERDRLVYRLGLDRLVNSLARQNRTSLIAGAGAVFGLFSLACCYVAFKYVGN